MDLLPRRLTGPPLVNGVLAGALFGIALASPLLAANDADYFKLEDGGEWVSDVETAHKDGTVTKAVEHEKMDGKVEKDGVTYYKIHDWLEPDPDKLSNDRLWRRDKNGCFSIWEGEMEHMEIPLPLEAGKKWSWKGGGATWMGRIVALETVTVGGRTYQDCWHVRTESLNGSVSQDFWEAPNVGTVKTESAFNGMRIETVLREYLPTK